MENVPTKNNNIVWLKAVVVWLKVIRSPIIHA